MYIFYPLNNFFIGQCGQYMLNLCVTSLLAWGISIPLGQTQQVFRYFSENGNEDRLITNCAYCSWWTQVILGRYQDKNLEVTECISENHKK